MSASRVHHAAEAFGTVPGEYERGRPGYPAEALDLVVETIGAAGARGHGRRIVDLAAGTGSFTRALAGAGLDDGLVAVEPLAEMAAVIARTLPGIGLVRATAESLPLPDSRLDAITVAQAFHWFDPSRALPEIARVLRPTGALVVIFNVRDERDPTQRRLEDIWEPYRGDTPTHRFGVWRRAFDDQPWFTPLRSRGFHQVQRVDEQGLVDRVVSVSFIAALAPSERASVERQVRSLAAERPFVDLAYRTDVWWTLRTRT